MVWTATSRNLFYPITIKTLKLCLYYLNYFLRASLLEKIWQLQHRVRSFASLLETDMWLNLNVKSVSILHVQRSQSWILTGHLAVCSSKLWLYLGFREPLQQGHIVHYLDRAPHWVCKYDSQDESWPVAMAFPYLWLPAPTHEYSFLVLQLLLQSVKMKFCKLISSEESKPIISCNTICLLIYENPVKFSLNDNHWDNFHSCKFLIFW